MPVPSRARKLTAALSRAAVLAAALAVPACGQHVDFRQALQITDVSGGWFDFGIVDGKNKLVPSVTFRIKKQPGTALRAVDINVHFKKVSPDNPGSKEAEEEMDEVFRQQVEFSEGDQTALITVRPTTGFTGDAPQSRAEMMAHRLFRDVRARVFAKESSTTWVDLVSYDIPRVLISK
jgi:hypothetical protein